MKKSVSCSPSNSIVFVHGGPEEVPPAPFWGAQVLATNTCLSILCLPEVDGPTEIVLGDSGEVDPGRQPDFSSLLRVPDGLVRVTTVDEEIVLDMPAPPLALVKIWRSHPKWPDTVTIGVEKPNDLAAAPAMLPNEEATRTALALAEGSDCLFVCDNAKAGRPDVFNPWQSRQALASGVVVPIAPASRLEVTDVDPGLSRYPVFDKVLPTPSQLVRIFPTGQHVILMADTTAKLTRVCAWVERRPEGPTAILALIPAEEP